MKKYSAIIVSSVIYIVLMYFIVHYFYINQYVNFTKDILDSPSLSFYYKIILTIMIIGCLATSILANYIARNRHNKYLWVSFVFSIGAFFLLSYIYSFINSHGLTSRPTGGDHPFFYIGSPYFLGENLPQILLAFAIHLIPSLTLYYMARKKW